MELTREVAKKVLDTVDVGLCKGIGDPVPGQMCVEAAVCFALGLPHSDNPPCVGEAVRAFKISLNDLNWSSDAARAKGMRAVAIAQLGSDEIDQVAFVRIVAEQTIRQIVPIALRAAAKIASDEHKVTLAAAAVRCEAEGTLDAATYAAEATYATYATAAEATYATAATYAARAATYAAEAAASANATYANATYAAARAAYAAARAADGAASAKKRDDVLSLAAKIAVDALVKLGAKGAKWLDLCA